MKKYVLAVIAAIVFSLIIMVITLADIPDYTDHQETVNNAMSVMSDVALKAVNAEISDALSYTVTDSDPQLYIGGIDDEFNTLIVYLTEPLPAGTTYQLYYAKDKEDLSEGNSVSKVAGDETDLLVINLPVAHYYSTLRLDIDADCQLKDIRIATTTVQKSDNSYLSSMLKNLSMFPVRMFFLCLVILSIGLILIVRYYRTMKSGLIKYINALKIKRKDVVKVLAESLFGMLAGYLVLLALKAFGIANNASGYAVFIFCMLGTSLGLLIALRRQFGVHPEIAFLIIALSFGALFSVLEPPINEMCWDDEAHYARAVRLSYGDLPYITDAENRITKIGVLVRTDADNKRLYTDEVNTINYRGYGDADNYNRSSLFCIHAYLPSAVAIWLTRTLGFPVSTSVVAGRLANLLSYSIIIFIAIRLLYRGKLFVTILCLLPMLLFLAGNFNYDPYCIAFVMLGMCIWISVYQHRGAMMTRGKAVAIMVCLALGVLIKAVYFPIILIAAIMPNEKFSSKAAARRYRLGVVLTTVLVAGSFVLPFLTGTNYSDTRGGSSVNAMQQVMFILSDPLSYLRMLFDFLANVYFTVYTIMNPQMGCVSGFAYISLAGTVFVESMAYLFVAMIILAWFAETRLNDKNDRSLPVGTKGFACLMMVGAICAAATSLYCGFTPVGSNTIGGLQARYMLPVMMPLLLIMRPTFLKNAISSREFNQAVLFTVELIMLVGISPLIKNFI